MVTSSQTSLERRAVVANLLSARQELLLVTGLGSASYDAMAAGDHDCNYYLWGAMGSAAMIGLGLAIARPNQPVLVLTGDGEMLMGLGSLATIALQSPPNLSIAVLDNGHFGETGMQVSHTGQGLQLDQVATACGFHQTSKVTTMDGVALLRDQVHESDGLNFATIEIMPNNPARILPPRDGVYVKNRFRAALGLQTI